MHRIHIGSRNNFISNISDDPCFIVAEIGINHNGDIEIAKKLVDMAKNAGCDAVKFQKRTPDICVPEDQKQVMRETPWGYISYLDYRYRVEFGFDEYKEIDSYCKEKGIVWFASCWDVESIYFIERNFNPPCYKVASASLTDISILKVLSEIGKPIIISTGMSTLKEIDKAVYFLEGSNIVLLHCNSSYPAKIEELNLRMIPELIKRYGIHIGYSGHEPGVFTSVYAVVMGACLIERHITLDRSMWGSDQAASLERGGLNKLVEEIRTWEAARGDGRKQITQMEMIMRKKLRRC